METKALAIYTQFDSIQKAAIALQQSGYFKDVTSQAQAIVKVMAGAELGLPPFASMSGINIIQGKPTLGANVLATLVKNSGRYDYQVKVCDNKTCELTWFENGKQVGTSTFTWEEAKAAGLTEKDNWRKWPSDMLFARAISRGTRRFAPGVFGGSPVYTPDEMGVDTNEDGVIDSTATDVTEPVKKEYPAPSSEIDLPTAKTITTPKGTLLGDLDDDKLETYISTLQAANEKNGLTPEQHASNQYKIDAALTILRSR